MLWTTDIWNEMERLRRQMESLMAGFERAIGPATYPLVNIYDAGDNILVTAELAGVDKDKVNITYADGVLTIRGKVEPVSGTEKMTAIREERAVGDFEKSFRLPAKIEQDKITATFVNGVLTITLPKAEEAKPKTIAIEAK